MSGTYGSLFSGCLGLDLGLEAAGWRAEWACENDEACRRVIARRRPELDVVTDVREVDAGLPAVDLLAGGFPCQDLSYAGRGAGLDGDRSGLWFEFARAIRVLPTRARGECARARYSRPRASPVRPGRGRVRGIVDSSGS